MTNNEIDSLDARTRVLVVEDEIITREQIEHWLTKAGYRVRSVDSAAGAAQARSIFQPHVVLLDLVLPDANDFELTREYGRDGQCGVIIVSGIADPGSRLDGLRAGADDYLVKPVDPEELLLKVGRLALRVTQAHAFVKPTSEGLRCGPWTIWLAERRCRHDCGFQESLTENEALLLRPMLEQPDRIFSRDELLRVLQRQVASASGRAVDSCVARVRKKLEANPARPELLLSVYGRGYRIVKSYAES